MASIEGSSTTGSAYCRFHQLAGISNRLSGWGGQRPHYGRGNQLCCRTPRWVLELVSDGVAGEFVIQSLSLATSLLLALGARLAWAFPRKHSGNCGGGFFQFLRPGAATDRRAAQDCFYSKPRLSQATVQRERGLGVSAEPDIDS